MFLAAAKLRRVSIHHFNNKAARVPQWLTPPYHEAVLIQTKEFNVRIMS